MHYISKRGTKYNNGRKKSHDPVQQVVIYVHCHSKYCWRATTYLVNPQRHISSKLPTSKIMHGIIFLYPSRILF